MTDEFKVAHSGWDTFGRYVEGTFMTITFDDGMSDAVPLSGYDLCARIIIPINDTKQGTSWPIDMEAEQLDAMEDELVEMLEHEQVPCRFIARLTYDGLRELVYQVKDEDAFRPVVGGWMAVHESHDIDVSEHEGWSFYDAYIQPNHEERRFMMEKRVIQNLIENGSDPEKPHELEYHFRGDQKALEELAEKLSAKGYQRVSEPDADALTMSVSMCLDPHMIRDESRINAKLSDSVGAELDGWGAMVVD